MLRLIASLAFVGLFAAPASAEPQYVYVRYGDGRPYLYVTTEPRPYHPPRYVRADGVSFDSEVGAACGVSNTDIYFLPSETRLDDYDRQSLANLAFCMTRGPLHEVRVDIVVAHDGSEASYRRSYTRGSEIIGQLQRLGVRPWQLTYSREIAPGWQSDRVRFRYALTQPMPAEYQLR